MLRQIVWNGSASVGLRSSVWEALLETSSGHVIHERLASQFGKSFVYSVGLKAFLSFAFYEFVQQLSFIIYTAFIIFWTDKVDIFGLKLLIRLLIAAREIEFKSWTGTRQIQRLTLQSIHPDYSAVNSALVGAMEAELAKFHLK
jgi:hypothetical protein